MSQKTSLPAVSPQKIKSRMLALSMARRFVQLAVLALFIGTVRLGWTLLGEPLLNGTLTSSLIAGSVPMSDPFALLQKLFAGHKPELTMVTGALIVLAIYVIAGGRAFCAWVCPMNIVTDAPDKFAPQEGLRTYPFKGSCAGDGRSKQRCRGKRVARVARQTQARGRDVERLARTVGGVGDDVHRASLRWIFCFLNAAGAVICVRSAPSGPSSARLAS